MAHNSVVVIAESSVGAVVHSSAVVVAVRNSAAVVAVYSSAVMVAQSSVGTGALSFALLDAYPCCFFSHVVLGEVEEKSLH